MIESFAWKPDFQQTLARFEAWWDCEVIDRPPVTLRVKPETPPDLPVSNHASLRERWLDVDFAVESAIRELQANAYPGDHLPIYMPNIGPELTGTILGCELEFADHTSYSVPFVHEPEDWSKVIKAPLDFDNVYWQTVEQMTDLAIERCDGRYIVAIPDLHGSFDLLASLRDPQDLCMDVIERPEVLRQAAARAVRACVAGFERAYEQVRAAGMPATTWLPTLHDGPAYVPSCDFWCLLSGDDARDLVLPYILDEIAPLERSIFHLDGPQALRHLDLLLEIDELDAVQWVYGAGAGRASDWIETYRKIQAGGKAMQVLAEDGDDALAVLDALEPEGVWLDIYKPFDDSKQAEAFLQEVTGAGLEVGG